MANNTNPCLPAALVYATNAQRPLFIFPAKPGEKKSRVAKRHSADGQNWGMTNNPETIKNYWRKWPDTAKSPSGSKHYYFTWPDTDVTIRNSDSKLAPGVDIRAEGGMVVAPPSYSPKYNDTYQWISPEGQGIKAAPAWLIKLLGEKPVIKNMGEPKADIDKVRTAMDLIPNDKPDMAWDVEEYKTGVINTRTGWEGWNTIMMALFRATAGIDEGFKIADKWCRKNPTKYNEKYTHYTWYGRFRRSPPQKIAAGTLFALADTEQPGWGKVWDHEHIEEIIEAKVEEAKSDKSKYKIRLTTGTNNNLRELETYLLETKVPFYVFGNTLVRPIIKTVRAMVDKEGTHRTKTAEFYDVDAPFMEIKALDHITFEKIKAKKIVIVDPPAQLIKKLLSMTGEWKFPVVTGVVLTPTMRADGSIFSTPGYDPITRLLMIEPLPIPPMPVRSTRGDAFEAIELLEHLISEFCFVDDVAKSVALAALITPLVRGSFQAAPMFVNKAPTPASGKSYLFDVVAAIAIGQRMPTTTAGGHNEEMEKRLGASLLAGQPLISIDNVIGELGGDALCQILTQPIVNVRVLGKSENRRIETDFVTLFATGNNLTLVGDITRRALICSLDLNEENTPEHQYNNNPFKMVIENRGKYVAACLTICRAYIQAGSPNKAPKLGSYEGWSDIVRSAIIWLGRKDPVLSTALGRAEDPTLLDLENMLLQWSTVIGLGEINALPLSKVIEIATQNGQSGYDKYVHEYPDLYDAVFKVASIYNRDPDLKRFTRWARDNKGRIIHGLKLVNRIRAGGGLAQWWVQNNENPNQESPGLRHGENVVNVNFNERDSKPK